MNEHAPNTMMLSSPGTGFFPACLPHRTDGGVRIILLLLLAFLLGIGAGAFWLFRSTRPATEVEIAQQPAGDLSDATKAVLQRLNLPVVIRFYTVLDPASVSAPIIDYARRADALLSGYQRESNGKLKVLRFDSHSNNVATAASADGIKAFNLDKGDASFLGMVVACQDRKESLPHLSVEWEPALESDLTHAIMRVIKPVQPATTQRAAPLPDSAVIADVRQLVPDLANTTVKEGTRILQEKALAEFAAAAKEMETQVKEAQQRIVEAQKNGSEAVQPEALKHLKEVQARQAEKLKEITARLQNQIAALEAMKKQ